ncbi:DMT family transporter [Clostridium pasteurianum]|uniref:DMT(Drug/metabolite transporter) superfamily permease n=1 Tax=Clostridium pasteurianum BC1 TaxID=86416 RepID=R4K4M7_CLOPA|nr:DMT family transporter [Clostridium pasteurianum]AGK96676.1 DMT(drug/metabolite transporter) superfamily permease [Clostridium pasteurianum BC1]
MSKSLISSIIYALIADAVWGLAFIVPNLLYNYTAVEITFGRYFIYGIFSIVILFIENKKIYKLIRRNMWKNAFLFAFCGNIGYYLFLVISIKLTGAAISTLIIGLLPITTALYGNCINHEFSFKKLLPSISIIFIGIFILNCASFKGTIDTKFNIYGIFCSLIALCLWTWYAVANARFLRENKEFTPKIWSTITGGSTLCLMPFFVLILKVMMPQSIKISQMLNFNNQIFKFWGSALVLGIIVSWIGTVFWNKASNALPVSLAGQMTVGETVFGLTYSFLVELRFPNIIELVGILTVIYGVLFGIKTVRKLKETNAEEIKEVQL